MSFVIGMIFGGWLDVSQGHHHVWQAGSGAVIIVSSPRIRPPSVIMVIMVIMVVTVVMVMKNRIVVRNLRIVAL